jgi:hypothetical protein
VSISADNAQLVLLDEQDRSLWDRAATHEGVDLLERSIQLGAHRPVGIYQLQAAIAALHAQADSPDATDWDEIADLYRALQRIHDTPVVRLNRAVAIAVAEGPEAGLRLIDEVAVELDGFHPFTPPAPICCAGRAIGPKPPRPTNAPSPCVPMTSSVAISYGAWRKSAESRKVPGLQHHGESPLATSNNEPMVKFRAIVEPPEPMRGLEISEEVVQVLWKKRASPVLITTTRPLEKM